MKFDDKTTTRGKSLKDAVIGRTGVQSSRVVENKFNFQVGIENVEKCLRVV